MIKITCDKHPNDVNLRITAGPEPGTLKIDCEYCIMDAAWEGYCRGHPEDRFPITPESCQESASCP